MFNKLFRSCIYSVWVISSIAAVSFLIYIIFSINTPRWNKAILLQDAIYILISSWVVILFVFIIYLIWKKNRKYKIDKIFESKTFKKIVESILLIIWIISGMAGFITIPGTTLQSQWAYGALFGLGLLSVSTLVATKLFWMLYNNITTFRNHVDEHYGNPE